MKVNKFVEQTQESLKNDLNRNKCLVIAVDLDKTLTTNTVWHTEDNEPEPNKEMINTINELHKSNFIVIHTARRHELYELTIKWLNKHGVNYHSISMGKMAADVYIDDKSVNPFT